MNGITYILGGTGMSDKMAKSIHKTLKNQARVNRKIAGLTLMIIAYTVISEMNNRELNRKLKRINAELEELKRPKGE